MSGQRSGTPSHWWWLVSVGAASALPVARAIANNPGENLDVARLALWGSGFFVIGVLAFTIAWSLDRGASARARATAIAGLLVSLGYGPLLADALNLQQPLMVILVAVALTVTAGLVARWRGVQHFLLIVPLFLIAYPIAEIVVLPRPQTEGPAPTGELPSLAGIEAPNVYWFIIDGLGREDIINELGAELDLRQKFRAKGFQVDDGATAPYAWTHLSLGATLNAEYFPEDLTYDELTPVLVSFFENGPPVFRAFEHAGFETLMLPGVRWSGFTCSAGDPNCLRESSRAVEDDLMASMTLVGPIRILIEAGNSDRFIADVDPVPAVEKALGLRASDGEGTKRHFVVLHVMGLHPPYRWSGPECTPQPGGVLTEEWLPLSDYFDAARCATRRTLESIDLILAQDPTAVVIVQGDHGPRVAGSDLSAIGSTLPTETVWFGTFLALRMPGCELGEGNNTVNVFRLVMACMSYRSPDVLPPKSWHFTSSDAVAHVVHP